jgi:ribosomal protein L16 Arg81 hydroxylase
MGPVEAEVIMRPGDVLYLRSFTPHRVETLSPCSLHVSFDLCDRQPSIEIALQMLLRHYDRDSSPRGMPPLDDLDKLFRHSRTAQYAAEIAQAQAGEDAGNAEFRNLLAVNRITYLDRFVQAPRPAQPVPAARDTRT